MVHCTVLVTGFFDLLHRGHLEFLYSVRQRFGGGARIVVGVGDDASAARLKGGQRPIQNEHDRVFALRCLRWVHQAIRFDVFEDGGDEQIGMKRLIGQVKPDVFVSGPRHPNPVADLYLPKGVEHVVLDYDEIQSHVTTTGIIDQILERFSDGD